MPLTSILSPQTGRGGMVLPVLVSLVFPLARNTDRVRSMIPKKTPLPFVKGEARSKRRSIRKFMRGGDVLLGPGRRAQHVSTVRTRCAAPFCLALLAGRGLR